VGVRRGRYKKSPRGASPETALAMASDALATTSAEVHKRTMLSIGHGQRRSALTRTLMAMLVLAMLLPTLDADAKRRKRKRKARLAPTPTRLVIYSTTERAEVEIDGTPVGETPMEEGLIIAPGAHTIRVSKRGWTEHIDTFEARDGETVELEIDLLPIAGIVRIKTQNPGATIEVNGKVVGVTPFDQDISVGKAAIRVAQSGYHDVVKTLDIKVGQVYDLDLTLDALPVVDRPKASDETLTQKWWFWTAVGGVVAGGAWAVAAILAADDTTPPPEPHTTILIP
jgi:hypothetical protein